MKTSLGNLSFSPGSASWSHCKHRSGKLLAEGPMANLKERRGGKMKKLALTVLILTVGVCAYGFDLTLDEDPVMDVSVTSEVEMPQSSEDIPDLDMELCGANAISATEFQQMVEAEEVKIALDGFLSARELELTDTQKSQLRQYAVYKLIDASSKYKPASDITEPTIESRLQSQAEDFASEFQEEVKDSFDATLSRAQQKVANGETLTRDEQLALKVAQEGGTAENWWI